MSDNIQLVAWQRRVELLRQHLDEALTLSRRQRRLPSPKEHERLLHELDGLRDLLDVLLIPSGV